MKKVHIALVGGQPIPEYIGIKYDGMANTVELVCSAQSIDEGDRIKSQFLKREVNIHVCSPVDLTEMEALAHELFDEYKYCEVTLNLTSGTKLWALTFYKVFASHPNAHFIYVDQTNLVTDINTKQTKQCDIEKKVRFELYGASLESYTNINEYTEEDFKCMDAVENFRNVNRGMFNRLTGDVQESDLKDGCFYREIEGSYVEYTDVDKIAKIKLKSYSGKEICQEFHSEHIFSILFKNGWFELKTAKELQKDLRNMGEGISIWLNCIFSYATGNSKNEIDVIVDLGTRLLFVECKTMIRDMTDIDKFRSALRNFSGTSTVGLFVTHDKPSNNPEFRDLYKNVEEKCRDNKIMTYNFSLWNEKPLKYKTMKQIVDGIINQQNIR